MRSLETARQTGVIAQPLASKITIAGGGTWPAFLSEVAPSLPELLVVSQAAVEPGPGTGAPTAETPEGALWITVSKPAGAKCDRCWVVKEDTGKTSPGLCVRCADAVRT